VEDALFWLLAAVAVMLFGVAKGGFGASFGGLAVPLVALVTEPAKAAAVLLPTLCVIDLFALRRYWRGWDWSLTRPLVGGALAGVALGGLAFGVADPDAIRLIIGVVAIVFAVTQWLLPAVVARIAGGTRHGPRGLVLGGLAGFTSCVAHAGGPPVQMHLLPMGLSRGLFQANTVLFFFVVNYAKLVPYTALGMLGTDELRTALKLLPAAPLGFALGVWLHTRVSDRQFYLVIYLALLLVGIKLTWDGLTGLAA
jgi:hypothetical protein